MDLRPYQQNLESAVYEAWRNGARAVLAVAPTGAGKTVLFSKFLADNVGASVAIAHRQELVSQTSLALARNGVRHRIIGSKDLCRSVVGLHIAEVGRSYYDPNARCAAAGVDTLVRMDANDPWFKQVTLAVCDEGHHLLRENKWGRAVSMFANARTLAVTATPSRADGAGLGRDADGICDVIVTGPSMRSLIDAGYLSQYKIYAPPSDIDVSHVPLGKDGDFVVPKLAEAIHKSKTIVGNVVETYKKRALGKLGITFAVDIAAAVEIAQAYRDAGVPAEVITGKTLTSVRASILAKFKRGEIKQLVNVAIFGEGYDLPAIEVVSMVAHTASFSKFAQEFGRALRIMDGKTHAIILDHVGNVVRHGLPDADRVHSLMRREKRSNGKSDAIPLRICTNPNADGMGNACTQPYERVLKCCPYCAFVPELVLRSAPDQVDGDLFELTADVLAKMRGDANLNRAPLMPRDAAPAVRNTIEKRHRERKTAQEELRDVMSVWAGWQDAQGHVNTSEQQRRFYFKYGIDTGSAQGLNARDAETLCLRIVEDLKKYGVENKELLS